MKWIMPIAAGLFIVLASGLTAAGNFEITVTVSDIREASGRIAVGLFRRPDTFPDMGRQYRGAFIDISGEAVMHTFTAIPAGKYAVAVYHDINDNKKLDTNFMKIPKEPYGFSQGAKTRFGPPKFEDAAFVVKSDHEEAIVLRH
jgi:uncharacterized protein (DUF2141 family)